jgi:hypothetical protein
MVGGWCEDGRVLAAATFERPWWVGAAFTLAVAAMVVRYARYRRRR